MPDRYLHARKATNRDNMPGTTSRIFHNARVLALALGLITLMFVFALLLVSQAGDPTWPGPVALQFVLAHAL